MKLIPLFRKIPIFASTAVFSHQYAAVKLAANTRQTSAVSREPLLIWSISGGVRLFLVCGNPPGRLVSIKFNSRRTQCNLCFKEYSSVFFFFIIWQIFSEHHQGMKPVLQKVFSVREIKLPTSFRQAFGHFIKKQTVASHCCSPLMIWPWFLSDPEH